MAEPRRDPDATPRLGALDQLDLEAPVATAAPGRRRRRRWPWLSLLVLAAVTAAVLAIWREPIGQFLVPASDTARDMEAAAAALARGELSRADGQGARELYQALLARDPDHPGARRGLAHVRDVAVREAREAARAGDAERARGRLALARTLAAPSAELAAIEADLARLEHDELAMAGLLDRAQAASAGGRLLDPADGALALYAEALRLQPGHALALAGRSDALDALLRQAGEELDHGDLEAAAAILARVVDTDPGHLALPPVQARLGDAMSRVQRGREQRLAEAAEALRAGRLETAAAGYRVLLDETPGLAAAEAGLDVAADAAAARARRAAADFQFDAAESLLAQARDWAPGRPAIAEAELRLAQARDARGSLPRADPREVSRRLASARAAMQRGALIDPPGDSAWDHLRQASALAPADADVLKALAEYDRRSRACFEDALAGNGLSVAQACLAAMEARAGPLPRERRRLADRWLAYGDERLGANERALARRALEAARALDPAHPGLALFEERLRRAGG